MFNSKFKKIVENFGGGKGNTVSSNVISNSNNSNHSSLHNSHVIPKSYNIPIKNILIIP